MKWFACCLAAVLVLVGPARGAASDDATASSCPPERSEGSTRSTRGSPAARPIPYPAPTPDTTPLVFLPGHISRNGSLEFNAAFSPDGKSFYFSLSADRQWDIYVSRHDGNAWGPPARAPFSEGNYSEADPVCAPDGKIYFISNRPKGGADKTADFDIWFVEPLTGGGWSPPQNVTELNSDHDEYYISFSSQGDAYFGSDRPGGFGSMDIYVSRRVEGRYLPPENLGPGVNTTESEHDPCLVSADGNLLVFKSENRPDGLGEADLYASRLGHDGKWETAVNLGRPINTSAYEYCCYLTPDQRYFFFSSELDIKWVDAAYLRRLIENLTAPKRHPAPR
jgi:hypothetical protein